MLHLGDDDVVALPSVPKGVSDDGQVVGLGGPRGEDYLLGLGPQMIRDGPPGPFQDLGGIIAHRVEGRGVAEALVEEGQHRLDDPWVDGLR